MTLTVTQRCAAATVTLLLSMLAGARAAAMDCVNQDEIYLISQSSVDSFQVEYGQGGTCDTITGDLHIEGDDITDLTALADLTSIEGALSIRDNPVLQDLQGLQNVATLGANLEVRNNAVLQNLDGLSGLTAVGVRCDHSFLLCPSISIGGNQALVNIDGLASITFTDGDIRIGGNPVLQNLDGLSGLTRIGGGFSLSVNELLADIDGLISVTEIGENTVESLTIYENSSLTDLDGLSGLLRVGWIEIYGNDSLLNIDGLRNLTYLGNDEVLGSIEISNNGSLQNVDGLSGVTEVHLLRFTTLPALENVGGLAGLTTAFSVTIGETEVLQNLKGLEQLVTVSNHLSLFKNEALSDISALSSLSGEVGVLSVGNSPLLQNLEGLNNIDRVKYNIWLVNNSALSDVSALQSVQSVGEQLRVVGQVQLEDCSPLARLVDSIDDGEVGPGPGAGGAADVGGDVEFMSNGKGCNSVNEILGSVPLMTINAGLNDAWFNPETNGQGFFLTVYTEIQQVFLSWYTFDLERPIDPTPSQLGDPGQRWITAQGPYLDNQAILDVWVAKGGVFDSPVPEVELEPDGQIILEFQACNQGTVIYDIPSVDRQGVIPIERVALDNVPQCYELEKTEEPDPDPTQKVD